jgi:CO/xanthine dehydrogenase Mo-binding subunit
MTSGKSPRAKFSAIGKSEPKREGVHKVTGKAVYAADRALPGIAWGKALRSPLPHARIVKIDASRARALPGVLAVLTAADVSEKLFGRQLRDMPVLARDRVRFAGEKVAAVAAETAALAEEAAALIDVEYAELPAVFDAAAATQEGAPLLHENLSGYMNAPRPAPLLPNVHSHVQWRLGDAATGFAESDFVFEQTFTTHRVHQGYLEPHACVVSAAPGERVAIWSSNKVPFQTRQYVAEILGLEPAALLVQLGPVGGDFGGKGSIMDIPLAYYLSRATGRPIKMVMTYNEELTAGNPRHPSTIRIKSGVKKDGTLWAREVKVVFNSGAYAGFKPNATINLPGARHAAGAYRIPHAAMDAFSVYTNLIPSGHMRGPGDPQVYFAVESHTDYIARRIGIDPWTFRRKNVLRLGDMLADGHKLDVDFGVEVLERMRPKRVRDRKPFSGHGIALCIGDIGPGECNLEVGIDRDGKVFILTTVTDTGTGAHTILRQIVAEIFGIAADGVTIVSGDTDSFATDIALGGSRVTFLAGQAAAMAATKLREKIIAITARRWNVSESSIRVARGMLSTPGKKLSFAALAAEGVELKEFGRRAHAERKGTLSFFGQAADVEIDPETGRLARLKITAFNEVGTIINPLNHQGQIEGGMMQGLGFATMENLPDSEGRIAAANFGDYKIPCIRDIPELETVNIYDPAGPGPFQSKPIGECTTTPTPAAIANAVYDAIGAQILDAPITAEKIYAAVKNRKDGSA